MTKMIKPEIATIFNTYPKPIREKLMYLRQLVLDTSSEEQEVGEIQETIKWGEPSYMAKAGSTIRLGWKSSNPAQYAMYFHCKTKLVDTFKELYAERLKFEGNRAILFGENDEIPVDALKQCIFLALTYHRRKNLPMLGV